MEIDTRKEVMDMIREKLERLSIKESELGNGFDLVRSGLMNSLEFVDLVADLEKLHDYEINFESALASGDFTTIGGLLRAFENKR